VARLGDKISQLKKEVDALLPPKTPSWSHLSEEEDYAHRRLFERWLAGEDLSDADPEDVRNLDKYGPVTFYACDDNRFEGTVDEWAAHYMIPEAAEARRKRIEAKPRE
jgi:hypothetical protein